jgi:phenylacetate-coenzyme A ligase PaaK-like adenylate-forming protein
MHRHERTIGRYNPRTMPDFAELRAKHAAQYQAALREHIERLTWPADRIAAERERGLRALLRVAKEQSPWHSKRLSHIDPDRATEADLASIQPMTKDEMMANYDAVVTDRRLKREALEAHLEGLTTGAYFLDEYIVVASGGSSGTRGVFVYDWNGWLACALGNFRYRVRLFDRAGIAPDATRVVIAGGKASHMSYAMSRGFLLNAGSRTVPATTPLPEIVSRINDLQPTVLSGYPTVLTALAREALAGRVRIAPKVITCSSEPLLGEMRDIMREAWGAGTPVLNSYFTSEGASAAACGEGAGMHLIEDGCIFEAVDASGRSVAPGERAAKLYITQLFNHAQPLIRYELTDEVTLLDEGECACGSAMRRIDDIGGRSDDLFTYQGEIVVHPMTFRSPLGRERHIVEYQVRQTVQGAEVVLRTDGPVDREALRAALERGLSAAGVRDPRVSVEILEGAFERQVTGKLKRFFPLG